MNTLLKEYKKLAGRSNDLFKLIVDEESEFFKEQLIQRFELNNKHKHAAFKTLLESFK